MIEINNVITLSDNKSYIVISKKYINDVLYLYIVNEIDFNNIKFCKLIDNKLIVITDESELKNIIPILNNEIHNSN